MIFPDVFSDVAADMFHIFRRIPIQSSNINEVIGSVSNFLLFFFFYDKISQVQKSSKKRIQGTKKYQKALKSIKTQPI